MKAPAAIMRHHGHWSVRPTGQVFYWPTTITDAEQIVRTCKGCQYYARQMHLVARELQTSLITWTFTMWGLGMFGPFKQALGGFMYLLIAVDKFTKWIEANAFISVRAEEAVGFFLDNIYRFRVSNMIITDNGPQFTGKKFLEFCDDFNIRVDWAAVADPPMNGQVECANNMILQGMKPRIFDRLKRITGWWAA
jgi:transposase InsO family protein